MKFKNARRNRGIALMLVLAAVALAALMGLALLSNASISAQVSGNVTRSAAAEYMAESAMQTAAYYLQYPAKMPAAWGTHPGHTIYVTGQTLSGVDGNFDIDATTTTATADVYNISATGRGAGISPIHRTATAIVSLQRVQPKAAASFNSAINVPARYTIAGNLTANGAVGITGGTISGTIKNSYSSTDYVPPTSGTVNYYGAGAVATLYTLPDLSTGTPQAVVGTITAIPAWAGNNPGHILYCNGDLTITAATPLTINGTLIVKGNLTVGGASTITVTPQTGMPAIVVQNNLNIFFRNITLRANGVVWVGGNTAWTGAMNNNSFLVVDGALLMNTGTFGTTATGIATITYNSAKANVTSLTTSALTEPVASVKLLDWKQ